MWSCVLAPSKAGRLELTFPMVIVQVIHVSDGELPDGYAVHIEQVTKGNLSLGTIVMGCS